MKLLFITIISLLLYDEHSLKTNAMMLKSDIISSTPSSLVLANKQNITINSTLLNEASTAHSIYIFGCTVTRLEENAFKMFTNMTDFSFSQNLGINTLPENIFRDNYYLENIYLVRNHLKSLEEGTFATLLNLRHLDLSMNEIPTLPLNLLNSSVMLTKFLVQRNDLKEIPDGLFDNASQLKSVDFSFNRIKKISPSLFKYNYQLESVSLQGNKIKHLEYGIEHLHVKVFNLHSNPLDMDNKKVIEVLKFLHSGEVKTGVHLPHHKHTANVQREHVSTPSDYLLIILIALTALLSVLVVYLIYIVKFSKQSSCSRYHNMQTLSREDLVSDDVWAETEINGNVLVRGENS